MENSQTKENTAQGNFDIKKFLLKMLVYWYLFLISGILAYLYAELKIKFSTPIYSVHATLLIESETRSPENILGGLSLFNKSKNLKNEIGVFQSYEIIRRTIKKLDFNVSYFEITKFRDAELYQNSPFVVIFDNKHYQTKYQKVYINILNDSEYEINFNQEKGKIKMKFGNYFENAQTKFKILRTKKVTPKIKKSSYYFYLNSEIGLVNEYHNKLRVQPQYNDGTILWLWSSGAVPLKETHFLNAVVDEYLSMQLEKKNKVAQKTIKYIDNQLSSIEDSLNVAQRELQKFRAQKKVTDITREADALFTEIENLYEQKNEINTRLKYYQYYLRQLDSVKDVRLIAIPSIFNINDPSLVNLMQKYQEAYEQLDEMSLSVIKDIPSKKLLKNNIKNIRNALYLNIKNNIGASKEEIKLINAKLAENYARLHDFPIVQREMKNIMRKFQLNDNIYTFLLKRRMEAAITEASNQAEAKVLDYAIAQNAAKIAPKSSDIKKKSLLLGLILPLLFIILKDFLNNKIMDKSDIENITDIPIIASIGHNDRKHALPVHKYPNSPIAEAFRTLRTNMQYMLVDKDKKVISLTSTVSGEGKSFCSANIAASIASSGKKTLLIGLDLRKPKLHLAFNLSNDIGVSTMLIGETTADEIIFPTDVDNLYVALSGPIPPNPAELLGTEKMLEFIFYAKEKFEYVILDTPPIAIVTDALLLSNFCDINIYVVRQNYTQKNALKVIDELYRNKNVSHLSILVNDVNFSREYGYKYGFGHGYGYSYGYGYGYGNSGYFSTAKKSWWQRFKDFLRIT